MRGIYFATHCGNPYQTWDVEDVAAYVEDLARAGANALGFWFDQHEFNRSDFDRPGSAAHAFLQRLGRLTQTAHDRGMQVVLLAMANESCADQVHPGIKADLSGRSGWSSWPTQLCLQTDEARAICVGNLVHIVRALPHVNWLLTWPYDQGGCDCARCAPWARTYVRMSRQIDEAVRAVRPGLRCMLSVWDMKTAEVADLLEESAAAWPEGVPIVFNQDSREEAHGLSAAQILALPHRIKPRLIGFPEISMLFDSRDGTGTGAWGLFGSNPVPYHLSERFRLQRRLIDGFLAYSEGPYEDFNKWVMLSLGQEPEQPLDSIVASYAENYLQGAPTDTFVRMVHCMERNWRHMGSRVEADETAKLAAGIGLALSEPIRRSFRWRVFDLRARMDLVTARLREQRSPQDVQALEQALDELRTLFRQPPGGYPEFSVAEMERRYKPWLG